MLKVKLARFGKRNQPFYRIVINEARDKRDGSYVAQVGQYAPTEQPKILNFDVEAYQEWLKKGAQPTETVASLFERYQSGNPFPPKKPKLSKKAKAKLAAAEEEKAAAAEAKATEKTEAPAPETPAAEAEEVKTDEPEVKEVKTEETKSEAPAKESTPAAETETK